MISNLLNGSLTANIIVFLAAAGTITWAGSKLAKYGDKLADRTGLGEALTGTVFLGLTTALPGLTASITAAFEGYAALAISNAIGGIAIQTVFLAGADIVHGEANLEHAAASVENMIQTAILCCLLVLVLLGLTGPSITIGHLHPMTPILFLAAGFGFWLVYQSKEEPMWQPTMTGKTVEDVPDDDHMDARISRLIMGFVVNALICTVAGALVAHTAGNLSDQTGISETLAGGLFSGVATSLPELVTTIAAAQREALTLAVSDIVGGNFFDVLFVFAADLIYLQGSLYHAPGVGVRESFLTALAVLLNLVLLLGLLYRQRAGPANIGFESLLMLLFYLGGYFVLILFM